MFKFAEGERIAIKNDNPTLDLTAGEAGKVWALYDTQPPAYEVTFRTEGGDDFNRLDVLATLVESYETKQHPIGSPNPLAATKYETEKRGHSR